MKTYYLIVPYGVAYVNQIQIHKQKALIWKYSRYNRWDAIPVFTSMQMWWNMNSLRMMLVMLRMEL